MRNFFTIAILALTVNAFAQQWTTKAPLIDSCANTVLNTSVVINNLIYFYHGNSGIIEVYDPIQDNWTKKSSSELYASTIGSCNNKIYAIGGYNYYTSIKTIKEYDPLTDTWTQLNDMPTGRRAFYPVSVNNKIYVISGVDNNYTHISDVSEYDPIAQTWSNKASIPTKRSFYSATVYNNKIYVIGGQENYSDGGLYFTNAVDVYDPVNDSWDTKTSMPTIRAQHSATLINGKIYVFGGALYNSNWTPTNASEVYDLVSDTWSSMPNPMPTARHNLCANTVNNTIFTIGGNDLKINETFDFCSFAIYDTITTYIAVTDTLIINAVLTGITPPNNVNTVKVYPNPANTHIYINTGNYSSMSGYTIRIDNSLGQTVYTTPVSQQNYYVDLSSWTGNGTYFIYIIDNLSNTIDVRKIILQ